MTGPLALVGGAEFLPGNIEQDRILAEAAAGRPAYVVCAAVPTHPERPADTARRWFAQLEVDMVELRVRSRSDASAAGTVEAARSAGLVYIAGGDPGRTVQILAGTPVWDAIVGAWRAGAALAGSSAGAMALCRWTLVRDRWPDHATRRPIDALALVPDCAVLPHYDTFGERWVPSAQRSLGASTPLLGLDEHTAAVWHGGAWSVAGPGSVTVATGELRAAFASGDAVLRIPTPKATALG
jgi:cyanophycinase